MCQKLLWGHLRPPPFPFFLGEEERPAEVQRCEPDPPRQLSKLLTTGGDQTLLLLNTLLGMLFMGPTTSLWYR